MRKDKEYGDEYEIKAFSNLCGLKLICFERIINELTKIKTENDKIKIHIYNSNKEGYFAIILDNYGAVNEGLNHFSACIYKEGIGIPEEKLEEIKNIFLGIQDVSNVNEVLCNQNSTFEKQNISDIKDHRNSSLFNITNYTIIQKTEGEEEKYDDFEFSLEEEINNNNIIENIVNNNFKDEDSNIQKNNKINNYANNNTSTTVSSYQNSNINRNKNYEKSSKNISTIKEEKNESDNQIFLTVQQNKNIYNKKDDSIDNKSSLDKANNNYKPEIKPNNIKKIGEDTDKNKNHFIFGDYVNIEKNENQKYNIYLEEHKKEKKKSAEKRFQNYVQMQEKQLKAKKKESNYQKKKRKKTKKNYKIKKNIEMKE